MKITLTYRGFIPGNKRPPEVIDTIRQDFHRQLAKLWGRNQLRILQDWIDSDFAANAPDFRRQVGSRTYLPIVSDQIHARARLVVTLRSGVDERRSAYSHGDIDNRAKSLVDALAVPAQESRIPTSAPSTDTICLLSDDSLVDELTVRTAPLLAEDDPSKTLAVVEVDVVPGDRISLDTLPIVI